MKVNKFAREYLEEFNVLMSYPNGKICRYKDDEMINVPDSGFMEEYSTVNKGNNSCQIGSISYSNAIISRLDIKIGRYCSIANGLNFIAAKHPLDTISTSSLYIIRLFIFLKILVSSILENLMYTLHVECLFHLRRQQFLKMMYRMHECSIKTRNYSSYRMCGSSKCYCNKRCAAICYRRRKSRY